MSKRKTYDVIVVGAGAAGIACARELQKFNKKFLLVEARSRIGGRAYSVRDAKFPWPLEMGAEFIHGAPPGVLRDLREFNIPFYDVNDSRHVLRTNHLKCSPHFWDQLSDIMKKLSRKSGVDLSIRNSMKTTKIGSSIRPYFVSYVEGFHAADLERISTKGLVATEETDDEELNGISLFRLPQGYDHFFSTILDQEDLRSKVRLSHVLRKIKLDGRGFELTFSRGKRATLLRARKVVLTLPVSILKSDDITWEPGPLPELTTALASVEMGHVQKLTLKFRSRFWENLSEENYAFLHAKPDSYFPTWWTLSPIRSNYLIAWQGGPKAEELSAMKSEEQLAAALKTLSTITKKSLSFLRNELEEFFTHDWTRDPYSQGACSYIREQGLTKSKRLEKPFGQLYLAGEATAHGSQRATIHGAMESGVRAAHQILRGTA